MGQISVDILGVGAGSPLLVQQWRPRDSPILIYKFLQKKLENVAIAGHCNLRPLGLPPPRRTLAENCHARKPHLVLSKCVQNFNLLALIVSEIGGGPKFGLGGAAPPTRP